MDFNIAVSETRCSIAVGREKNNGGDAAVGFFLIPKSNNMLGGGMHPTHGDVQQVSRLSGVMTPLCFHANITATGPETAPMPDVPPVDR